MGLINDKIEMHVVMRRVWIDMRYFNETPASRYELIYRSASEMRESLFEIEPLTGEDE